MHPTYSIIIPAYNEAKSITRAINEVDRCFRPLDAQYELIVVDDGSTDQTASIIRDLTRTIPNLSLLPHVHNQGKGAAVRTGMLAANGTYLIFLDADLSTYPQEFLSCVPLLASADIIIGSRGLPDSRIVLQQPWYRSLAGRCFNMVMRWYLHLPYRDTQCGFKVFHKKTRVLFQQQQTLGWAFDVELLIRAQQAGFRIREIPVRWQNDRDSKVHIWSFFAIIQELRRIKRITSTSAH